MVGSRCYIFSMVTFMESPFFKSTEGLNLSVSTLSILILTSSVFLISPVALPRVSPTFTALFCSSSSFSWPSPPAFRRSFSCHPPVVIIQRIAIMLHIHLPHDRGETRYYGKQGGLSSNRVYCTFPQHYTTVIEIMSGKL